MLDSVRTFLWVRRRVAELRPPHADSYHREHMVEPTNGMGET
jgi:hypothetical protein